MMVPEHSGGRVAAWGGRLSCKWGVAAALSSGKRQPAADKPMWGCADGCRGGGQHRQPATDVGLRGRVSRRLSDSASVPDDYGRTPSDSPSWVGLSSASSASMPSRYVGMIGRQPSSALALAFDRRSD